MSDSNVIPHAPQPVLSLQYAAPDVAGRPPVIRLAMGWLACAVATALIQWAKVETVLATGPVIGIVGVLTVVGGLRGRSWRAAIVGGLHCAIVALFIVLVNVAGWGPDRAREPFLWMGLGYTAVMAPVTAWAALGRRGG